MAGGIMDISSVDAFQIYDSRGNPTLEVELTLQGGVVGRGLVPSGASVGQYEALELRDGDPGVFGGKSVFRAVANVRGEIAGAVCGRSAADQRQIDEMLIVLDGTPNKSRLGANALLGVSMAVADARAKALGVSLHASLGDGVILPLPEIQIIGGGAHANWRTDLQDWLVIATGARTFEDTMEITSNVFHAAAGIMKERGRYYGAADEGGLWPDFQSNEEPFQLLVEAIQRAGYTPGKEAAISLDIAASDLYDAATGTYTLALENRSLTSMQFMEQLIEWCERYPVVSIEDPAADDDWDGWTRFASAMSDRIQIVGDDVFTTNPVRIREGIDRAVANSALIKLNQIGTVTETLDAIRLTQQAGWAPIVSARSGETEDAFISHLAVATDAGQLKVGSFCRSERMAKWNECLRIARGMGERSRFAGREVLAPRR